MEDKGFREQMMRISIALGVAACAGALLFVAPQSASANPAAFAAHGAKSQDAGSAVIEVGGRKSYAHWRRGPYYSGPYFFYYRGNAYPYYPSYAYRHRGVYPYYKAPPPRWRR